MCVLEETAEPGTRRGGSEQSCTGVHHAGGHRGEG